jgi:hypothetical protein
LVLLWGQQEMYTKLCLKTMMEVYLLEDVRLTNIYWVTGSGWVPVVGFCCDIITFGFHGRGVSSSAAFTLTSCHCGMVSWTVTACSLQESCQCFGKTCCFHIWCLWRSFIVEMESVCFSETLISFYQ